MIAEWLARRRTADAGTIRSISIDEASKWRLKDGALTHQTGGFFSVCGYHVRAPGSMFNNCYMPMIDQPELGLLGFVVANGVEDMQWLVQAKSEPGSVGWVQAAPTVQATRSNYMRRHGGAPTRFLDLFDIGADGTPNGRHNSEQGNRFLNKFNCNATRMVTDVFDPKDPDWDWFPASYLRKALAQDFTINTDARSVIATGDWALLRKEGPIFSGSSWASPNFVSLRSSLSHSHSAGQMNQERAQNLLALLTNQSSIKTRLTRIPLESMRDWILEREGLRRAEESSFVGGVQMFSIEAPRREVKVWDQPFLVPKREERVCLLLAHADGQLQIALRTVVEPGFLSRREFGPSFQTDGDCPNEVSESMEDLTLPPLLSVWQSDEGGRFMRSITRYDIIVLDESRSVTLGDQVIWVNLAELEWLCRTPASTTNELRSAVSVLLSLA